MFVHANRLEHLLKPLHYRDVAHYHTEVERLFLPSWHFVGTASELPRPGDFRTFELFDRPVLLRNIDGRIHAFENVCAHRHCLLTSQARGHDERLRCQYHGWEYDEHGRTGRIPDARCFRPFDRENSQLHKFRLETCGELLFVSLADDGPSLAEHLGEFYDELAASFAPPFRSAWVWQIDVQADWKIPVENTLEMYHVPCLHPKTLKELAPEETVTHVLGEHGTTYYTQNYQKWIDPWKNWMVRRVGGEPSPNYVHHHCFPNFVYIGMDTFRLAETFLPTGLGTSRQIVRVYSLHGNRKNPLALGVAALLRKVVASTVRKILLEDLPVFSQQQKGMAVSTHPGAIGTIEERIHSFHRYVIENCGDRSHGYQPAGMQSRQLDP